MSAKGKINLSFKTTGESIEITTNHNYVKIWCSSSDDRDLLDSLNIKYSDYPLDQEIEEEGNFYLEEDIEPENYEGSWVYTSLLADFDYDSLGLSYELLEDLFLFEDAQADEFEDEDHSLLAKTSDEQIAFYSALEKEAFRITGNLEKEEKANKDNLQARCWFFCSGRTQPRGRIQVRNTTTNGLDPVVGVKVRTYRWFVWGHGYTNENGEYSINKRYRGNPRYTIDFDNPETKVKLYASFFSFSDASYRAGRHSRNGYSKVFENNSYGWRFATVNNAIVDYRDYCDEFGIPKPTKRLRTIVRKKNGDSAAPMLRYTRSFIGSNSYANVSNHALNSTWWFLANFIKTGLWYYMPDIIISAPSHRRTDQIQQVVYHEFAHASHHELVGSSYWAKYVSYIITYGFASGTTYGDGTGRNAEICGIGEMWGNYFASVCFERRYRWRSFAPEEDWFNPGFLERVVNNTDLEINEVFYTLRRDVTTFETLIGYLKNKTENDEEIDNAFNIYTDWP